MVVCGEEMQTMSVFSLPKPTNTTNTDTQLTLRVFLEAHRSKELQLFYVYVFRANPIVV